MTSFNRILIPVDTFENSFGAVQKALDLSDTNETIIHLIKNVRPGNVFSQFIWQLTGRQTKNLKEKKKSARDELRKIRMHANADPELIRFVSVVVVKTWFRSFLEKYLFTRKVNLIIRPLGTAYSEGHLFSQPFFVLLQKRTGIPVLTILRENKTLSSKTILVPINGSISERKVRETLGIARKYNAHIHIITILDESKSRVQQHIDTFYLAYKLFSDFGCSPHYKILISRHKEALLLRFAQQHNISMIFAYRDKSKQPVADFGRKILRFFQYGEKVHRLPQNKTLTSST